MRLPAFLFTVLLAPVAMQAGPIYGSIFMNGSALPGAWVEIFHGNQSQGRVQTLDDGSYRMKVTPPGRCTIVVTVSNVKVNVKVSAEVISSDYAGRYNFAIVQGGGGYELRRQ